MKTKQILNIAADICLAAMYIAHIVYLVKGMHERLLPIEI